jgi:hypothetical protein
MEICTRQRLWGQSVSYINKIQSESFFVPVNVLYVFSNLGV